MRRWGYLDPPHLLRCPVMWAVFLPAANHVKRSDFLTACAGKTIPARPTAASAFVPCSSLRSDPFASFGPTAC